VSGTVKKGGNIVIGIVDYGMGNLFSVSKALERLGADYFISADKTKLLQADALILPGVGSFRDAMERLPAEESEENGPAKGLGLLPGRVRRFTGRTQHGESYKVPHMGWNRLKFVKESPLLKNLTEDYVYFVHSYYVDAENSDVLLAKTDYHKQISAIVGMNNILGMQFHPEKSSRLGMALLNNFLQMATERKAVQ